MEMTNEEIIEKIRTTLAEEFEVDVETIQPDAPLIETLEMDSLDFVDMVVLIEQNFGFTVNGNDFVNIKTFQDFYDFIVEHLDKPNDGMER
jgi:acyl carrier protein